MPVCTGEQKLNRQKVQILKIFQKKKSKRSKTDLGLLIAMMTETNPFHVLLACLNFVEIVERYPLCFPVFFL